MGRQKNGRTEARNRIHEPEAVEPMAFCNQGELNCRMPLVIENLFKFISDLFRGRIGGHNELFPISSFAYMRKRIKTKFLFFLSKNFYFVRISSNYFGRATSFISGRVR